MNSDIENLKKVRSLIEKEENWCTGIYQRTTYHINGTQFVAYCLLGACDEVQRVNGLPSSQNPDKHLYIEYKNLVGASGYLTSFNDNSTHAAVIAFIDKVIARLEAEAIK